MGCNRCGVANQIYTCSSCGNQSCLSCGVDIAGRRSTASNVCQKCGQVNTWRK